MITQHQYHLLYALLLAHMAILRACHEDVKLAYLRSLASPASRRRSDFKAPGDLPLRPLADGVTGLDYFSFYRVAADTEIFEITAPARAPRFRQSGQLGRISAPSARRPIAFE